MTRLDVLDVTRRGNGKCGNAEKQIQLFGFAFNRIEETFPHIYLIEIWILMTSAVINEVHRFHGQRHLSYNHSRSKCTLELPKYTKHILLFEEIKHTSMR